MVLSFSCPKDVFSCCRQVQYGFLWTHPISSSLGAFISALVAPKVGNKAPHRLTIQTLIQSNSNTFYASG